MNSQSIVSEQKKIEKTFWTSPTLVSLSLGDAEAQKLIRTNEGKSGLNLVGPAS